MAKWMKKLVLEKEQNSKLVSINTLRQKQNGRHFADDIFKCIFLNENVWISIKISLKFVPEGPINNITLVQIVAWRRPGDKPLYEAMMVNLPTHICVSRPQWVNGIVLSGNKPLFIWKLEIDFKRPEYRPSNSIRKFSSMINFSKGQFWATMYI